MKQFIFFFFLCSISGSAQNFSQVDEKIKLYPKLTTVKKLADKIDEDFSSDLEKVRAVYFWLTQNIKYDLEKYYNPTQTSYSFRYATEEERLQKIEDLNYKIVAETLSSRKAVCEGYARVFKKLCTLLNIENEFISGYVRISSNEIGKPLPNANHAWNAVKINGTWKYFDATWGAGYEENGQWKRIFNDYYFDIPKEKIFFTHFPKETLWQLRVKRMSKQEFYNQPIYNYKFLNSDLELVSPKNGVLKKNKDGFIEIQIKKLKKHQKVFIGFKGYRMAKIPSVKFINDIGIVKILVPKESKQVYLLIDNIVVLEFKVE